MGQWFAWIDAKVVLVGGEAVALACLSIFCFRDTEQGGMKIRDREERQAAPPIGRIERSLHHVSRQSFPNLIQA